MIKQTLVLAMLAGLLAVGSGCELMYNVAYRPLGPCGPSGGYGMAGPGACGACGEMACGTCGPVGCGEVGCAQDCGEVGCAPDCCDPCCEPYHPCGGLVCLADLFRPVTFCGPVCGERYWCAWHNDPPDCWDPCNTCGQYVGGCSPKWPRCPNYRGHKILGWLLGPRPYAYGCGECGRGGCGEVGCVDSCGGGCNSCGACDDCGCGAVEMSAPGQFLPPSSCPDCMGRRPSYTRKTAMARRPSPSGRIANAGAPVTPAPKLLSVTDKAVQGDRHDVAARPTTVR